MVPGPMPGPLSCCIISEICGPPIPVENAKSADSMACGGWCLPADPASSENRLPQLVRLQRCAGSRYIRSRFPLRLVRVFLQCGRHGRPSCTYAGSEPDFLIPAISQARLPLRACMRLFPFGRGGTRILCPNRSRLRHAFCRACPAGRPRTCVSLCGGSSHRRLPSARPFASWSVLPPRSRCAARSTVDRS